MEPLIVTAETPTGFAAADDWSPSLDGILAYWSLRERLGEEEFALGMSGLRPLAVADDLPLGREAWGGHWWWQASSPLVEVLGERLQYYHRRFDALQAETYTAHRGKVDTSAGPYKNYRNARRVRLAPRVTWHCLGEAAEIRRLLLRCGSVGAGGAKGLGQVVSWTVEPGGDEMLARLHRPLPIGFAREHGLAGGTVRRYGLRPPGRLPEHQVMAWLPA